MIDQVPWDVPRALLIAAMAALGGCILMVYVVRDQHRRSNAMRWGGASAALLLLDAIVTEVTRFNHPQLSARFVILAFATAFGYIAIWDAIRLWRRGRSHVRRRR